MDAERFIQIIDANRELLENEESTIADDCVGCPLWVAITVEDHPSRRWGLVHVGGLPCNPDPTDAADALKLHDCFTLGIADVWDTENVLDVNAYYRDVGEADPDVSALLAAHIMGSLLHIRHKKTRPLLPAGSP